MALGSGRGGGGLNRVVRRQRKRKKPSGTAPSTVPSRSGGTRQVRVTTPPPNRAPSGPAGPTTAASQGAAGLAIQRKVNRITPTIPAAQASRQQQRQFEKQYKSKPATLSSLRKDTALIARLAGAHPNELGLGTSNARMIQASLHPHVKPEDVAVAAATLAAPEVGGALLRGAARGLKALRGARGAESAAEATRAAEVARGAPKEAPKVRGVRARAQRAQMRASRAVEKPTEAPKKAVAKVGKAAVSPRSKVVRSVSGVAALTPPVHEKSTGPGRAVEALVQGHLAAIKNHPLETAGTTARIVESIPTATAAIPADIYLSAKEGSTKPLEGLAQQQVAYGEQVAKLFSGNPKKVERTVTKQVGLVPAATAVLGGTAALKAKKAVRVKPLAAETIGKAVEPDKKLAKLADQYTKETDPGKRIAIAHKMDERMASEPAKSRRANVTREKRRAAQREGGTEAHLARETKSKGKHKAGVMGRRESQPELEARLSHRKLHGHINWADTLAYVGPRGLAHDTADLFGRIKSDLESLRKPGRKVAKEAKAERNVLSAMLADKNRTLRMLRNGSYQAALAGRHEINLGRSIEAHSMLTGKTETTPNPAYERATAQVQATAEGVLQGHERHPHELRGEKLPRARAGQDAEKAVRAQAKTYQRRASGLRKQADALQKAGNTDRAATLQARAQKYAVGAEKRLAVTDRFKRAKRLDMIATKIGAGHAPTKSELDFAQNYGGVPGELRKAAEGLRAEHLASQAARHSEAMTELAAVRQKHGLREPIYFKQTDVTRTRTRSGLGEGIPGARGVKKERFRSGSLAAEGRTNLSAEQSLNNLVGGRVAIENAKRSHDFLNEQALNAEGNIFHTTDYWNRQIEEGKVPPGYTQMRAGGQEFAGGIQRNAALRKMYEKAQIEAKVASENKGEPGQLAVLVPESAKKEYTAQYEGASPGKIQKTLHASMRIQQAAMIATSPTWFEFQLLASPAQMLAAHWNPARYARAAKATVAQYRKLSPQERSDMEAVFQANSSNALTMGTRDFGGMSNKDLSTFGRALGVAYKTPVGRFVRTLGRELRQTGGPLIALNRRYEGKIRVFAANMEADKLAGLNLKGTPTLSSKATDFMASMAGATDTIYSHQKILKGMNSTERMQFYLKNPKARVELENRLYRAMGDWTGMTKAERTAASVVVFYPFVRYSLNWMFRTFPKDHPVKAALLINLAQSNASAYEKERRGKPTFMQDWGNIVLHPEGKPTTGINLARSVPGGNAVLEALGSGKFNPAAFFNFTQPAIGSAISSAFGYSSTGYPSSVSPGDLYLRNLRNLNPISRQYAPTPGPPPSFTSNLYKAVAGTKPTLYPAITDIKSQRDVSKLDKLFATIYGPGPSKADDLKGLPPAEQDAGRQIVAKKQAAWKQVDAMALKYGVTTPKAEQRKKKTYDKRSGYYYSHTLPKIYPPKKSSSGGLSGGGLTGGGLSGSGGL